MIEQKAKITEYLRKAVLAQVDKGIDFKNDEFYKISRESFRRGNVSLEITEKLFEKNDKEKNKNFKKEDDEKNIDENIYIILCAKVIKTEVEGSQKKSELEDLTGVFFIPAILNKRTSSLLPAIKDNKLPWFPREILKPMIEPELAIGDEEKYDEVVSNEIYNIYKIFSWEDYINYCMNIYESTTECPFFENYLYNMNGDKEKIFLEDNVYIFLDKTINPTLHIKNLYSNIIKQKIELPLYEKFIALEKEIDKPIIENTDENRRKHYGQMGGQYGLSVSQRESINHFNNIDVGDILAINGPPGTGKTTLLQSVVASQYVKHAIEKKEPPLIVATSTNNQAVTNIIESFGKIVHKYDNNLEKRWIDNLNSFAIYFPSTQKRKSAIRRGFQFTDNQGGHSLLTIDNEENIEKSKKRFLNETKKLFPDICGNLKMCKDGLYEKLVNINAVQNNMISIIDSVEKLIEGKNISDYINQEEEKLKKFEEEKIKILNRVKFWKCKYNEIPRLWKIFAWIEYFKRKISQNLRIFIDEDEEFEENIISLEFIENYYANKIKEINSNLRNTKKKLELIDEYINKYQNELIKLEEYDIDITNLQESIMMNKRELDNWLDINIRYVAFWIAVHYYEARWLEGENELTSKQKGTTYANVLIKFYKRLSLITPCLVMTFYMLPKQFAIYNSENEQDFLYNIIDTLIVDEAGQVSTEIGACSFALAKKAIVVGDENQIDPVWGVEPPLDKSLAIQEGIIDNVFEFEILKKYGITSSNSSIMKCSCISSNYSKYGEKGLFLSEHRRCFDDIIAYCNDLVYKGKLQPLRGSGNELLPKMGYHFIESKKSEKIGISRKNNIEAVAIAEWILKNERLIFEYYSKVQEDKVLEIVTPFKEQAKEISDVFDKKLPLKLKNKIAVGTVHAFQGGERKVIIMSTTYGSEDGCFFINNNKNIMNVAVSRAEDSFLVFGDINCLDEQVGSPSGLLKKYVIKDELL